MILLLAILMQYQSVTRQTHRQADTRRWHILC